MKFIVLVHLPGAYAAIRTGYKLGVKRVYAFGLGTITLNDRPNDPETSTNINLSSDLRSLLSNRNNSTEYYLYYNQGAKHDLKAAEELRGFEDVSLYPVSGDTHNVIGTLHDEQLLPVIFPEYRGVDE